MRSLTIVLGVFFAINMCNGGARAQQAFPPGTFSIDGVPIVCGANVFILDPRLGDVGMNTGQGQIILNPNRMSGLPTFLKLYWAAHECGHSFVGADEVAADCWAIKTGRNQGWFPQQDFAALMQMFANNPGDIRHPTGPQRVANMWSCYNAP
jgi:hypothetical protein